MSNFLNTADDCQWLRDTALNGCPGMPDFQSFTLYGNEDSPDTVELYESADPLYTDRFFRVSFTESAPFYCVGEWVKEA